MAARSAQFAAVRPAPMLRSFADAALAIAAEIERNELPVQVKQAMQTLSDDWSPALQLRRCRHHREDYAHET